MEIEDDELKRMLDRAYQKGLNEKKGKVRLRRVQIRINPVFKMLMPKIKAYYQVSSSETLRRGLRRGLEEVQDKVAELNVVQKINFDVETPTWDQAKSYKISFTDLILIGFMAIEKDLEQS